LASRSLEHSVYHSSEHGVNIFADEFTRTLNDRWVRVVTAVCRTMTEQERKVITFEVKRVTLYHRVKPTLLTPLLWLRWSLAIAF